MPWSRLCDQFDIDQKVLDLEPATIAYFIGCLSWCNRNLTDGRIGKAKAKNILRLNGKVKVVVRRAIKELLVAGLWADREDHFQVVSYLKFNKSRSVLLKEKEQNRLKIERWRASKSPASATKDNNGRIGNRVTGQVTCALPDPVPVKELEDQPQPAARALEEDRSSRARDSTPDDSLPPPEALQASPSEGPVASHGPPALRLVKTPPRASESTSNLEPVADASVGGDTSADKPGIIEPGRDASCGGVLTKAQVVAELCRLTQAIDAALRYRHLQQIDAVVGECTAQHLRDAHADAQAVAARDGDKAGVGLVLHLLKPIIKQDKTKGTAVDAPAGGAHLTRLESWKDKYRRQEAEKFFNFVDATELLEQGGNRISQEGF